MLRRRYRFPMLDTSCTGLRETRIVAPIIRSERGGVAATGGSKLGGSVRVLALGLELYQELRSMAGRVFSMIKRSTSAERRPIYSRS
jgi:hypothetical protein